MILLKRLSIKSIKLGYPETLIFYKTFYFKRNSISKYKQTAENYSKLERITPLGNKNTGAEYAIIEKEPPVILKRRYRDKK